MASHGRTIIMSIHQPRYSIYRLFDTLTLLVSGKMVYHGPAAKALNYFADIGDYLVEYNYYHKIRAHGSVFHHKIDVDCYAAFFYMVK